MRSILLTAAAYGVLCLAVPVAALSAEPEDRVRIAPASNGVEIDEIYIARRAALGAVKTADLTNMRITLSLQTKWQPGLFPQAPHLVRIHDLGPVEDDTGKVLATERRRSEIEMLKGEVRGQNWEWKDETLGGPKVPLLLNAPARGAGRIKRLQGRAEVILAKPIELTFTDLVALSGKELTHIDHPPLKNLKLKLVCKEEKDRVAVSIAAPFNYASPWLMGRLQQWEVEEQGEEPRLWSESNSGQGEGAVVERTYVRSKLAGLTLRLIVLAPVETKTFEFDFRDVELP